MTAHRSARCWAPWRSRRLVHRRWGYYRTSSTTRSPSDLPDAAVIVPARSGAVPSETADTAPTQRERHLERIAEHGRMGWQRPTGYNRRALRRRRSSRFKRVIGTRSLARRPGGQAAGVAIAVRALNRMLELGRPKSVRIA